MSGREPAPCAATVSRPRVRTVGGATTALLATDRRAATVATLHYPTDLRRPRPHRPCAGNEGSTAKALGVPPDHHLAEDQAMPIEYLCPLCMQRSGSPGRCSGCARQNYREDYSAQLRHTGAWHKARARALNRDDNQCQWCGSTQDLEVHHIQELSEGGSAFDLQNLLTLCKNCHPRGGRFFREAARGRPPRFSREKSRTPAEGPGRKGIRFGAVISLRRRCQK